MKKNNKSISVTGEAGLINFIKKNNTPALKKHNIFTDIGDDCFVFNAEKNSRYVVTTDILIENTHFKREFASAKEIGQKAVEVNVSDIASMGTAKPLYMFTAAGMPKNLKESYAKELFKSMKKTCEKYGIYIAGGDTTASELLTISVTVIGITDKKPVTRTGAKPGDLIYVTNTFGDSGAGLDILFKNKNTAKLPEYKKALIKKHLCPEARLEIANRLCEKTNITSMTDSSDGLNKSLELLTTDNRLGAEIDLNKIPVSENLIKYTENNFDRKYNYALFGAEEFELVFTVNPKDKNKMIKLFKNISCIGKVTDTKKVKYFENGKEKFFENKEYRHF